MSNVTHILDSKKLQKGGTEYTKIKLEHYESNFGEVPASHKFVINLLGRIMGKSLTIIDAVVKEHQQNKAVKDLFREVFGTEMEFTAEMMFDQSKFQAVIDDMDIEDLEEIEPVTIEEALGVEQ